MHSETQARHDSTQCFVDTDDGVKEISNTPRRPRETTREGNCAGNCAVRAKKTKECSILLGFLSGVPCLDTVGVSGSSPLVPTIFLQQNRRWFL
jgi:hypothetical protein